MAAHTSHRILITGGTGFVAGFLVRHLQAERPECQIVAPGLASIPEVDIRDRDAVDALIRDARPTALVHLAAVAAPAEARDAPRRAWDINVSGTMNLAESILRHAPDARFVYVGSSDAYGASFVDAAAPLPETAALQPMSAYAATKAAADILIGQMAYDGLKAVRFRPFNHTGPGQSDAYVIPAFARQIARIAAGLEEPVVHVGNVDVARDFLDVRDVVRAYATAALGDLPHEPGLVFNLASGTPTPLRTVLEVLMASAGISAEIRVDPAKLRGADVSRTSGDAQRARKQLGWNAAISLERTLGDVLDYWRNRR